MRDEQCLIRNQCLIEYGSKINKGFNKLLTVIKFSTGSKSQKQFENNLGFFFKLPHPEVSTAGFYFGENPGYGRRELVFRSDPEYFTVDNTIRSSGNVPEINPYNPIYKFKRSDHTKKL